MESATSRDKWVEQRVREAQAGSRQAFGEISELFRSDLLRYAASRTGPMLQRRLEPEDVVQDALRVAYEGLDRLQWRGAEAFALWLRGIVEHRIRNASRGREAKLTRISIDSLLEPAAKDPTPSRMARREERFERLRRVLRGLSPDHRRVIELARIRGLKIREIAERMNRTEAAVKKLLSRALGELREKFGDTLSLGLPARAAEPEAWADGSSTSEPSEGSAGSHGDRGTVS